MTPISKSFLFVFSILFTLTSCEVDEQDKDAENTKTTKYLGINEEQIFTVNSDNPISITTKGGNKIDFPQNAFLNAEGIVSGAVKISILELLTKTEMIREEVFTNSEFEVLESQGEFEIIVTQNEEELTFSKDKRFYITPPDPIKEGMRSWYYEGNENRFWVNKGDTLLRECWQFKQLVKDLDNIDPQNEVLTFSNKLNEIRDLFNMRRLELGITDTFTINIFMEDSTDVFFNSENEYWIIEAYGLAGWRDSSRYNVMHEEWPSYYPGNEWGKIVGCGVEFPTRIISFDPNAFKIPFSQLGWCNIDRFISTYGAFKDCTLEIEGAPSAAKVLASFENELAIDIFKSEEDGIFNGRLPEGASINFIVYYKLDDKYYLGTQTITSTSEMTMDINSFDAYNTEKELLDAVFDLE